MIKYLLPLAAVLGFVSVCHAQAPTGFTPAPFNRANVILIQTPDSANAALLKMGKLLVAQGYTIRKLDRDFGTLTTEPRRTERKAIPTTISIQARFAEGQGLLLTAELIADTNFLVTAATGIVSTSAPTPIVVLQTGKQPSGNFLHLQQMAQLYGAPLAYGKN